MRSGKLCLKDRPAKKRPADVISNAVQGMKIATLRFDNCSNGSVRSSDGYEQSARVVVIGTIAPGACLITGLLGRSAHDRRGMGQGSQSPSNQAYAHGLSGPPSDDHRSPRPMSTHSLWRGTDGSLFFLAISASTWRILDLRPPRPVIVSTGLSGQASADHRSHGPVVH